MMDLISITEARNNLSQLVREVVKTRRRVVLLRDSQPQVALVPYEEIAASEDKWQVDMDRLMVEGRQAFKRWLKKNNRPLPKTEEEMYELVNEVAGRS